MAEVAAERKKPLWRRPIVIGSVVTVAVVAAAVASTTFVGTGTQVQAADTATEFADLNYDDVVVPAITDAAQPLGELVTKIVADPDATGEELGSREDAGKPWSYAAEATGVVGEGEFGEVGLTVDGMPAGITVGVAIPPFGSNTAIRDAGTDLTFGDFKNQTEFQNVAIELNKRAVASVYGSLDPASLVGTTVHVVAAFTWTSTTGGEIDHVTLVPVALEVQS